MVNEFRAAPPEVWDVAIYGKYRSAYDAVGMKPILPAPDYMELSDGIAQMLHDLGEKCSPIQPSDAALPVFEVSMMESNPTDSVQSDLWNVANAAHTTDDELFIYGMDVVFTRDNSTVVCQLSAHYCDHAGGGYEELGTILLFPEDAGFSAVPFSMEDLCGMELYDYESITGIAKWLAYLWRGVQYSMLYRTEAVHMRHVRVSRESIESAKKAKMPHARIVKVQRVITMIADEDMEIVVSHGNHTITLPCWGVAGHWRTCASGKRVWVAPYYKGCERDRKANYCKKEYRFEEVHDVYPV